LGLSRKGKRRNLRWGSKKAIPNGPKGDEIYQNSLILVRHWRFELGDWWPRVWIWAEIPTDCKEQEWVLNGFSSKTLGI
jgi:hypothetical protein